MINEIALRKWKAVPADVRKRFEENVFCGKCMETTIENYTVELDGDVFTLKGKCATCKRDVVRVID